ncbi:MAG: hypothetical protein RL059_1253 [Bacteroidota bacterium]
MESEAARIAKTLDFRLSKGSEIEFNLDIDLVMSKLETDPRYRVNVVAPTVVIDNANFDLWDEVEEQMAVDQNPIEKELERFKLQPPLNKNSDLVQYWLLQKNTFPRLFLLAMDYLAVPASSVPAERVNSLADQTYAGREQLSDTTFCAEMCVRSWIKLFKILGIFI